MEIAGPDIIPAARQDPMLRDLLRAFPTGLRATLRDNLVGIYLTGSLLMDDFVATSSDIDFLVVTHRCLSVPEVAQVVAVHERLRYTNAWGDRLEGGYAAQAALRPWGIEGSIVAVEPGTGVHAGVPSEYSADNMLALRDYSATLYGPPAAHILPLVDHATLTLALRDYLADLVTRPGTSTASAPTVAAYILNIARCLYGLRVGRPCTKTEAAVWLSETAPSLESVLTTALAVRRGTAAATAGDVLQTGFVAVQRVVRQWSTCTQRAPS